MEADMSMTTMAFDPTGGEERLFVEFYLQPVQNKLKSEQEGRPIFEDREYIRIIVPGDKDNIVERPVYPTDRERFPRHYRAFQQKVDQGTISGTPLSAWPVVTRAQVEELAHFGVKTVEQLAGMADSHAQRFMGINMLRSQARDFLEASKDSAYLTKLRKELEDRDEQITVLKDAIEKMQERIAALEE